MLQALGGVLLFPVWWFTRGFMYFTDKYLQTLRGVANQLAVGIWIKNIFVPMYGSYDISGRIISFVVRVAQIVVRGIALMFVAILLTLALVLWMLLPVIAIIALLIQGLAMFANMSSATTV